MLIVGYPFSNVCLLDLYLYFSFFFFFFSSRRRHTRWNCDWSSDVCSSDLISFQGLPRSAEPPSPSFLNASRNPCSVGVAAFSEFFSNVIRGGTTIERSEERRVGKECRSRWSPYDEKKKKKSKIREDRVEKQ